jgi:hypothetical protein
MGGVFNTVNLHVYHYAGNNPVKYVDPDGKAIFHGGKYPGWSEDAPQARVPYINFWDKHVDKIGFSIDSARIDFDGITLRLWKGDYGQLRKYAPEDIRGLIGGIGGEIGFYNKAGIMIRGERPENTLGLIKSEMQLFSKLDNKLLAEYGESSGWATAFDPFATGNKENMYTVNTFTFKTASQAEKFAAGVKGGMRDANNYLYNNGERVDVRLDEINRNKLLLHLGWNNEFF